MAQRYGGSGDPPSDLLEWLRSRPTKPIPFPASGTDTALLNRPCLLMGWSVRESTGSAAAAFRIFSGTTTGGNMAASVALATSASSVFSTAEDGVFLDGGMFVDVLSGSFEGAIYAKY